MDFNHPLMRKIRNMTHSQDTRVAGAQDGLRLSEESIASVSALVNKYAGIGIDDEMAKVVDLTDKDGNKVEKCFPWIKNFAILCRSALSNKSIKLLENIMMVYLQHVSIDVKNCYMKPNRASKLKKCMNEELLFFHMVYQDIREPMGQPSFYLDKMTDLMSMYIDMEIKASRRRKETTEKIVSRLISALFIFLDRSQLHMLDVILKARLITRANREICMPILRKLMTGLHLTPLYDLLYVRCILVFKLWKKIILKDADEKKRVTQLAVQKLPVPKDFLDKSKLLVDVLPRIPKCKKNITMFFMLAKFNVKAACKAFLKYLKESQPHVDKSLFYGEHPDDADKTLDVDGRNSNLYNNIWSSLSTENETLSVDKEKAGAPTGKKQKNQEKREKKLKKSKANKNATGSIEEKKKKKKKVKKKSVSGDAKSTQDGSSSDLTGSLQVSEEEEKNKNKSQLPGSEEMPGKATAQTQVQEELLSSEQMVVVKTEENVPDVCIVAVVGDVSKEPEEQGLNQVNKINSMSTSEIKENLEPTSPVPLPVTLVMEAAESMALEQVNQVNSACSDMEALRIRQDTQQVNGYSVDSKIETEAAVSSVNRVFGESVIVPANSNNLLTDSVLNTSQRQQQMATVRNETIACRVDQDMSSVNMGMTPKIIHPYLVHTPLVDESEITNIVPPREVVSYACDSSVKVEDSMHGNNYVVVDQEVPIPKEGPGGVDHDYFNNIIDYDSDVEILFDHHHRESRQRSCSMPGREEILVRNERDLLPRDTVPSNIFATENSELFIEALGGVLPVSSIDYEPRGVLGSEDGVMDNPFLCTGDEGNELESPSSEPIDENEKRSFTSMLNNIRSSKDKELFAQFGTERQEWLERNGHRFMYGDSMLGLHQTSVVSSDDDGDSCYEFNSASSSPRQRIGGGKVGSQNYATSVNEKEVTESSPSSNISDSSLASNNTIRDSYIKLGSGFSGRDTSVRPQVGHKTPAPGLARSSHYPLPTSTPCVPTYKLPNVNATKCKDRKAASVQKKPRRTRRHVSVDVGKRNYVESNVDDTFPGIVDAHNATDKTEKGAATPTPRQKASSRGTLSSETGNNVVGKSVKSNNLGLYQGVPMMGAGCVPPSIPYPTIPLPATMAKAQASFGTCNCRTCYLHQLAYLSSYHPLQHDQYGQVPIQLCNSGTPTQEATLKQEDAELLRKIEESLSEHVKSDSKDTDELESKYKAMLNSSLPLKKRLKTLTHTEPTKVKTETVETNKSTQAESFPSYPARPMISIAELELNKSLMNKIHDPKSVRTPVPTVQKYSHYNGLNNLYCHTLPPGNAYVKRIPEEHFQHYLRYMSGQSEVPKPQVICKNEGMEDPSYKSGTNQMSTLSPVLGVCSSERKPVIVKELPPGTENVNITYAANNNNNNNININNNVESFVRAFKTPAQLKDITPAFGQYSVLKAELSKTPPMPPLIPLVQDAPMHHYPGTVKQETVNIPLQMDVFSQTVLDLSKQAFKDSKRNSRKKKNTDSKPRNSRRSKRETVIQTSESLSDLDNKNRRKRNSHIPR